MSDAHTTNPMRPAQRIRLLDQIGRALQHRFTLDEIKEFLSAHGITLPKEYSESNSKRAFAKHSLKDTSDSKLLSIARDLDLTPAETSGISASLPRNWTNTKKFKVFISHISKDKDKAVRLKDCLSVYAIDGFVAHQDIHPTLEWQEEIERALRTMDAFIAIHTVGFFKSIWTQQEIGFAVARDVKIISLKMGEDPTGFISKHQALARRNRTAEDIAKDVDAIFAGDDRTANKLAAAKNANIESSLDDEVPF